GKGVGLQIWKPDNSQVGSVAWNQQLAGDPILNIDGGALLPNGDVVAVVRGAQHAFALVKASGSTLEILAESGAPLSTPAQLTFTSMIPGMKTPGNALVQAAGDPWNVVEVRNGQPVPLIQHGERFDGNVVFFGSGFNQARRSPSGDLHLFLNPFGANVPNYGMYKWADGRVSQTAKFNMTWPDGTVQYTGSFYGVTDSGYLLATGSTSRNHSRLYLHKDGTPRLVTTNSQVPDWTTEIGDAGAVIGWDNAVVTETGRVMAQLRLRNTPSALYLWEDGRWTEMATLTRTRLLDLSITGFSQIRALGNDFYASFSMAGGGSAIARWVDGKWDVLVSQNDTSPTGQPMAGIGNFDVNHKGEIVFLSNSFSWPDLIFRKATGEMSVVTYTFDFDTFRNQLVRFTDVDLRDDGRIYFVALDVMDRYALFEALPK
ncbi:MAG: hypothetical protein SGI92_04020, partial [Bryobacteraceae bacterium]|nr:hypothetical protein [Bryobacteraceae bacterium]